VSRQIVVSPEARAHLDDLYSYIAAAASPLTALRFIDAILDRCETLKDFPNVGIQRDDILPGLRILGFRRRVSIAFVAEPSQSVVVGIFYGGQDFEAFLKDD
jgi:plasmid stabilization system protein ParE